MSTTLKSAHEYNVCYHTYITTPQIPLEPLIQKLKLQTLEEYKEEELIRQKKDAETKRIQQLPSNIRIPIQTQKYKEQIVSDLDKKHGLLPMFCFSPPEGSQDEIQTWLYNSGLWLYEANKLVAECHWTKVYHIVSSTDQCKSIENRMNR